MLLLGRSLVTFAVGVALAAPLTADIGGIGQPTPFTVPSGLYNLALGPDGNVWGMNPKGNLGKVMPDGSSAEVALPWGLDQFSIPYARTFGSGADGNLWVVGSNGHVARVTPAGGVSDFTYTTGYMTTSPIAAGADGALWFYDRLAPGPGTPGSPTWKMTRVDLSGQVTNLDLGISGDNLAGLISGGDGSLWFIDDTKSQIVRYSLVSRSVIGTYAIASPSNQAGDNHLALAFDGNVWFTRGTSLDRVTPDGKITEYRVPSGAATGGLATGGDGNLWFSEPNAGKLGQLILSSVTPAGSATINESALIAANFYDLFFLPPGFSAGTTARALETSADCTISILIYQGGKYLQQKVALDPPCTREEKFAAQLAWSSGILIVGTPVGPPVPATNPLAGLSVRPDAAVTLTTTFNLTAAPGTAITAVTTDDPAAVVSFTALKATITSSVPGNARLKVTPAANAPSSAIAGAAVVASSNSDPDPRTHVASFFSDPTTLGRSTLPPSSPGIVTTPVKRGK